MTNKLITIIILLSISVSSFSQSKGNYSDKYYEPNMTSMSMLDIIDKVKFIPTNRFKGTSIKKVKTIILMYSPEAIKQLNINAWYICTNKHDEYFQIWNMYYTKIERLYYDQHCKELVALMDFDGFVHIK